MYKIAALYKFIFMAGPQNVSDCLTQLCKKYALIIAHEGINGTLTCSYCDMDKFLKEMMLRIHELSVEPSIPQPKQRPNDYNWDNMTSEISNVIFEKNMNTIIWWQTFLWLRYRLLHSEIEEIKVSTATECPFYRIRVGVKPEIVTMDCSEIELKYLEVVPESESS